MSTYRVVVETGSCSMPDNNPTRWEYRTTCGHLHRTREAAEKCLARLQRTDKHGNCSALWYNARIHNQNGERV